MVSDHPVLYEAEVQRATAEAEFAEAGLTAWAKSEIDRYEAAALERVVTTATDIEFSFFDQFIAAAGSSAVKQELLARKLDLLSRLNDQRIRQRFS